jgi:hypothetical protein
MEALRRAMDLAVESANLEPSIALTLRADRPLLEQVLDTLLHLQEREERGRQEEITVEWK